MKAGLLVALCTAALAAAHGGVLSYNIAGTNYTGFTPYNTATGQTTIQRQWATYDPIEDVTSSYLACNNPGTVTDPQLTANVTAGTSITAYWNSWPHDKGPMMVYMANCNDECDSADPTELDWFKIDEAGLLSGTVEDGYWGAGQMIDQGSSWTSTIPSETPDGYYMIRFETLAIHSSYDPQFYMECAQLTVTGGGSGTPSPTVKFPGGYGANDPGVYIDIYSDSGSNYTIPGPAVWPASSSSSSAVSGASSAAASTSIAGSASSGSSASSSAVVSSSTSATGTGTASSGSVSSSVASANTDVASSSISTSSAATSISSSGRKCS